MKELNDPDKEEQEIIDKAKMGEVKTALQSQIIPDDDEEEVSQEHIEDFTKRKNLESKKEPSFDVDEVDYERNSQARRSKKSSMSKKLSTDVLLSSLKRQIEWSKRLRQKIKKPDLTMEGMTTMIMEMKDQNPTRCFFTYKSCYATYTYM